MYFGCTLMAPHGGLFVSSAIPHAVEHVMQYLLSIATGHDCLRPDVRAVETVCGCANSLIHLPLQAGLVSPRASFFISIVIKPS